MAIIHILRASSPPSLGLRSPGLGLGFVFEDEKLVSVGNLILWAKSVLLCPLHILLHSKRPLQLAQHSLRL